MTPSAANYSFAFKRALAVVGVFWGGLALAACAAYLFCFENQIHFGIIGSAKLLLLASPVAIFGAVFVKGCATCRVPFDEHQASFPPNPYEQLVATVQSMNPQSIYSFLQAPGAACGHRAVIELCCCRNCRRACEIRVFKERNDGHLDKVLRSIDTQPQVPTSLARRLLWSGSERR